MKKINIGKFNQHIDNGGISIDIDYDSEDGGTLITFNTNYCGYPDIITTLRTWHQGGDSTQLGKPNGDVAFLRELGLVFIYAANQLNSILEKEDKKE